MTTRPQARSRRYSAVAIIAALAVALTVAGPPSPASAKVPTAAKRWSSLMYHSLTPTKEYVALRKKLASQRITMAKRAERVPVREAEHEAAQTAVTKAVTADAGPRTRYALAREELASARNRLTVATQLRPKNAAAVTAARNAVTAAAETASARRKEAATAAAALKTAQATARTATVELDKSITALETSKKAVQTNQRRLKALDKSAELRADAAATSRDVVTAVRGKFAVADTTTVNGIRVHRSVAFAFRRMLSDAKADGVVLSGGGFRTKKRQIELRKINGCPDIWTAPASSCRVPTAIPGRSLHELGLAIDITSGGRTLTRDSAGFAWLDEHAHKYGFVNLPSEAWHWSITGG